MARLQRVDAHLDTLSDELCQVNTHVGRIAQRQVVMGGFITSPSPTSEAYKDNDDDAIAFNDEDDGDASSSSADKIST